MHIVYLRKDLRLQDNNALWEASQHGEVVAVYALREDLGSAQKWWLKKSLESLSKDLKEIGIPLVLRRGSPEKVVGEIFRELEAVGIFYNLGYDGLDPDFSKICKNVQSFPGFLLFEPTAISSKKGEYYKVYTSFQNACAKELDIPSVHYRPKPKPYSKKVPSSDSYEVESSPWEKHWKPGEEQAHKTLKRFIDRSLEDYKVARDFPAEEGTSTLSAHLAFGEINPAQIFRALEGKRGVGCETYKKELIWREFSYHLLYHFPKLPSEPFDERFKKFDWRNNESRLKRWQEGKTGYPIVDAGMRQLFETGWMHNRVRMIVGSFLTKDLLIPWQKGAEWFFERLVDADLANNSGNWQWVAGCGADAAPFFRIFNPVLQGERFDPEGDYIRKWVPELSHLDKKQIHAPWKSEKKGEYPSPMIDHKEARGKALDLFSKITKG